jgi:hypothetical protein
MTGDTIMCIHSRLMCDMNHLEDFEKHIKFKACIGQIDQSRDVLTVQDQLKHLG